MWFGLVAGSVLFFFFCKNRKLFFFYIVDRDINQSTIPINLKAGFRLIRLERKIETETETEITSIFLSNTLLFFSVNACCELRMFRGASSACLERYIYRDTIRYDTVFFFGLLVREMG